MKLNALRLTFWLCFRKVTEVNHKKPCSLQFYFCKQIIPAQLYSTPEVIKYGGEYVCYIVSHMCVI